MRRSVIVPFLALTMMLSVLGRNWAFLSTRPKKLVATVRAMIDYRDGAPLGYTQMYDEDYDSSLGFVYPIQNSQWTPKRVLAPSNDGVPDARVVPNPFKFLFLYIFVIYGYIFVALYLPFSSGQADVIPLRIGYALGFFFFVLAPELKRVFPLLLQAGQAKAAPPVLPEVAHVTSEFGQN